MNQRMIEDSRLDVIIFGASGFAGKQTILESINLLRNYSWGVAGRNELKLQQTIRAVERKVKRDLSSIPIIIADVSDAKSISSMVSKCKVLINLCGPYHLYGEAAVHACIQARTHLVDMSYEPQYMEKIQMDYGDWARRMGVYVVSACGFGSIPIEMGTVFIERNFNGCVNSIETFAEVEPFRFTNLRVGLNYGSWQSVIYGLAFTNELIKLRKRIYLPRMPNYQPKLLNRPLLHKSGIANDRWAVVFPGSDTSIAARSQRYLYDYEQKRPIQLKTYMTFDSILYLIVILFLAFLALISRTKFGRDLLLRYPRLFSMNYVSHSGPSESQMRTSRYTTYLYGKGWSNHGRLGEPVDQFLTKPTKRMVAKVSGANPFYGTSCMSLTLCARTILSEIDRMPSTGGVLTPAAAFHKTSLLDELQKNGMKFEIISVDDENDD